MNVYLVVSIRVREGKIHEFLQGLSSSVTRIRREKGCIQYMPLVDLDIGPGPQIPDGNVVTILEKWDTLESFRAHLSAPELAVQMEREKDIIEEMTIKVLREASM